MPVPGRQPAGQHLPVRGQEDHPGRGTPVEQFVPVGPLERRAGEHGVLTLPDELVHPGRDGPQPGPAIGVGERDPGPHLRHVRGRVKVVGVGEPPAQTASQQGAHGCLAATGDAGHDHDHQTNVLNAGSRRQNARKSGFHGVGRYRLPSRVAISAGVVLAGGRSSRMGTPKAALEWHGSTLLRRTVGIVARATNGPVVVVRAIGQDLPGLPEGTLVADDPREGKGPVQGIAAGLAALSGRAEVAFVSSTDMPFLHPAFIRRVLGVVEEGHSTDVALPVARGYRQPLAAAYRVTLAEAAERLVKQDRLRPAFLFAECQVETLDDATLKRDPVLAALDPDLDSVLNVNTPADYAAASTRGDGSALRHPGQGEQCQRAARGPRRHRGRRRRCPGPRVRPACDGGAERRPDHPRQDDAARGGRHGLFPVRGRGRLAVVMPAGGYFGQAIVVDVTSGTSRNQPLPDSVLRGYIGGSGLGTWLLCQLGTAGADPLGPRAPLAFVFSPLVGTPLTTSAKFAVVAKSPLTGMLTDALASSQFAIAGKLTGHDAIVIDGRAPELSVLLVDGDGTRLQDASHLAGMTAADADRKLRDQLGRGWRVAAIGPAGEIGVRYATISHD